MKRRERRKRKEVIVRNKEEKKRENCKEKGRITANEETIVSREIQKSETTYVENTAVIP